jgi:hypothetical protein
MMDELLDYLDELYRAEDAGAVEELNDWSEDDAAFLATAAVYGLSTDGLA